MSRSTSQIKPKQALQSYLDGLLQDAFADFEDADLDDFAQAVAQERQRDAVPALKPRPLLEREQAALVLNTLRIPDVLPVVEPAPEPEPELVAESSVPESEFGAFETHAQPAQESVIDPLKAFDPSFSTRPAWSEQAFECLLFDVAGLTLAVPLVSLGSIYAMDGQELTPLFGQPDWYLGLLPSQSGNLRVLDTARWVLADRYRDEFRDNLRYVISVEGFEWGLAVHQVSRSIRLDPGDVKWRSERTQRPWLAGTVIEHMCALLDVQALAQLIAAGGQRV